MLGLHGLDVEGMPVVLQVFYRTIVILLADKYCSEYEYMQRMPLHC